jgi:hypothetical protein
MKHTTILLLFGSKVHKDSTFFASKYPNTKIFYRFLPSYLKTIRTSPIRWYCEHAFKRDRLNIALCRVACRYHQVPIGSLV